MHELLFVLQSVMLGLGLAMDAFSVSLANGLNESSMNRGRMCRVAGIFSLFQFAMPMLGWILVSTIANLFGYFEIFIPWIALVLLCFIGGKMIYEGVMQKACSCEPCPVGLWGLIVQGIATSIDALSVGFTISDYDFPGALLSCLIIGTVTFILCLFGVAIGKRAGCTLASKAGILGGSILVFIGLEIFITSFI